MDRKLSELAKLIEGEISGDPNLSISGACGIKEARQGDITFLANPKYFSLLDKTGASAVITSRNISCQAKTLVKVDNPSLAFAKVISLFVSQDAGYSRGIHKSAVVGKDVLFGADVSIGAHAVIGDKVTIGDGTIIYPGCFIGNETAIGDNCIIYSNVSLRERIKIGSRVIIHSGTVVGSDGFGFVAVEGVHHKIPQIGTVEIQDDVEIGANVAIDRARFDKTVIGKGTKIDNLVQIAHNVVVGQNCIIVAQAGISGSTIIENGAILAGQCGLVGHITVGEGAIIGGQAGVTKSVKPKTMVSGYPARPHDEAMKAYACIQKLPELFKEFSEMKKEIKELKMNRQK